MMEKKKLSGMVAVVTKTIRSITIPRVVRTSELEWDAIRQWTKTRPVTGLATTFGKLNG
jgi:glyoxylate utilization-related uncharacterized protein